MTKHRSSDKAKAERAASLGLLFKNGWYVLPSRGAVVTSELIDQIQEELDHEDLRRALGKQSQGY